MQNKHRRKHFDANAVVREGMAVNGAFVKKLPEKAAMVVSFSVGKKKCSGVLHVSQFPSSKRSERDLMFDFAQENPEFFYKLMVAQVVQPQGKRKFTIVRLTAREDFDREIFQKSKICKNEA